MWTLLIIFTLSCGVSISELRDFSSEQSCRDFIPQMRALLVAASPGANPVIDCVKK